MKKKKVVLTPPVLMQFLEKMSLCLVSFFFCLDDCCWDKMKVMTDSCIELLPLGKMKILKKLDLSNFGFDDINVLGECIRM